MTCTLCPRRCGADRQAGQRGICGADHEMRIARIMLHPWEEPCLGPNAGTIFFSGCPLHCVYCQNNKISRGNSGEIFSPRQLADAMLRLNDEGAYNINLVTPTHFIPQIISALDLAKPHLTIPVVFNTGGYERADTIAKLEGYADIFLTDFKYGTCDTADKYSAAPDYPQVASSALSEMFRITGEPVIGEDGMMKRGIILRHLVLPGCRRDSIAALRLAADAVPPEKVILSLMRQYTPEFAPGSYPELKRRITSFEYESVLKEALSLGFDGFSQGRSSAQTSYTPDF